MNLLFFKAHDIFYFKNYITREKINYDQLKKIAFDKNNYLYVSEALQDLHQNLFYTPEDLADLFKIPESAIRYHLIQMGVYSRHEMSFKREKHQIAIGLGYKNIHECIVTEYNKHKSAQKVAEIMKCVNDTILIYLRKHNIKINSKGGPNSQKMSKNHIKQIVSRFGESTKQLSIQFRCSVSTINRYHRNAGLGKKKSVSKKRNTFSNKIDTLNRSRRKLLLHYMVEKSDFIQMKSGFCLYRTYDYNQIFDLNKYQIKLAFDTVSSNCIKQTGKDIGICPQCILCFQNCHRCSYAFTHLQCPSPDSKYNKIVNAMGRVSLGDKIGKLTLKLYFKWNKII